MTGRARRAFRENGPGHKLMDALGPAAYFFTLTPTDLDPSLSDDPSGLYGDTVSDLLAAVARAFRGPVYAVAEVGKGSPGRRGRLHVHCVAHRDDGPATIKRDTACCQEVYDVLGIYRYLSKPPEPYSLEAELDAAAARVMSPSGRLPNSRRHFLGPERLEWSRRLMALEPNSPPAPAREPRDGDRLDPVDEAPEPSLETPQRPAEPTPRPFDPRRPLPFPNSPGKNMPRRGTSRAPSEPRDEVGHRARARAPPLPRRARPPPPRLC